MSSLSLSSLTPIIVAFIGIIGTITPVIIGMILPQKVVEPLIEFKNKVNLSENSISININNNGNTPATNMSLFINTFHFTISNLTNIFSTTDIFIINKKLENKESIIIDKSDIRLKIPIFLQGEGSTLSLKIYAVESLNLTNQKVSIRAIFDQGSSYDFIYPKQILTFLDYFYDFWDFWNPFSIYYSFLSVLLGGYGMYYILLGQRKKYFGKIRDSLLLIRHILKSDIYYDFHFENLWRTYKSFSEKQIERFHKQLDIKDFILLDDLFFLLDNRNRLIQVNSSNNNLNKKVQIKELNEKLFESINKTLLEIKWNRYL